MSFALFTYYRIIPIFIAVMLMFTISVGATYEQIGTVNSDYFTGTGIFEENLLPSQTGIVTVTTPSHIPLVADLDNNGDNEIVLINGNSLIVYKNTTLSPVTSITMGNTSSYVHAIIYDIDGDSSPNIIIASNSTYIQSFEFNGTHINKEMQMRIGAGILDPANFAGDGEVVIQCMDTNKCLAVFPESRDGLNGNALYAMGFDSSGNNGSTTSLKDGAGASIYCFARQKHIAINQRSGQDYFVVSNAHWSNNNGEELFVYGLEVMGNLTVNEIYDTQIPTYDYIAGTPAISTSNCDDLASDPEFPQNSFTSPLSMDVENAGDEEIVVGYTTSLDTFKMITLDSNGGIVSGYPFLQTGEGSIVSNVMRGEVFGSGNFKDFCMLGFDPTGNRLDLLCGSEQTGTPIGATSEEFFYNFANDGLHNITDAYNNQASVVHFGEHATDQTSEVITTYGIFEIDYTTKLTGATIGVNSVIDLIHTFATQNASVIPVDYQKNNHVDMLLLSPTNLIYLNDQFLNSAGQILDVTYDPCPIGTVIKQNTTMQIVLEITDPDGDKIRGGATTYYTDSNQVIKNQTTFLTSGSLLSFEFDMNKTINAGLIQLFANDIENNNTIDIETQTFTVGSNGISRGETSCTQSFNVTVLGDAPAVSPVAGTAFELAETGLSNLAGVPINMIWLLLMVISAGATIGGFAIKHQNGEHINGSAIFGIVLVEQVLLLVFGAMIGWISVGLVITIGVLSTIILGLFFASMVSGNRGN